MRGRLTSVSVHPKGFWFRCAISFVGLTVTCWPQPARAWGRRAHRMVNAAAVENLPEPLRTYIRARESYLAEHASDPDDLTASDPTQRIHHFTDAEAYEPYPFPKLREQFVVNDRGPTPRQAREGDSIWQIDLYEKRLVEDWKRGRWAQADHDAVFLAHFACDLTQPLHTVLNYDGQLTHQLGIHARFESELVNALNRPLAPKTASARYEANVRARIFGEFLASYRARQKVFAADREAAAGKGYLDPQYFPTFLRLAGPVAKARLEAAVSFVSSLWYTAWVRAGKPDLRRSKSSR
jgi:hypothetical protein